MALAGQLVTIYGLTLAIGAPLLGIATGRMDRGPLMLGGLALFIVACLIGMFAPNFATLLASRVLAGVGAALFTPNAAALAAQLVEPQSRGRAIALVFAGFSVASVIGVPLGTCVGGQFGWRSAFGLVAGLSVIAILFLLRSMPRRVKVPTVATRTWFRLVRQPAPMLAVATTVLYMAGQYTLFTYIAALLVPHGIGATGLSALLVWFGVAGVLGNMGGGWAVDRVGAPLVVTLGVATLLIAILTIGYAGESLSLLMIAMALWGAAAFAVSSAQQARLVNQNPRLASATLALNTSALYIGQAVGALVGGIAIHWLGLAHLHWAGAVLLTTALVISIWESWLPLWHHAAMQPTTTAPSLTAEPRRESRA